MKKFWLITLLLGLTIGLTACQCIIPLNLSSVQLLEESAVREIPLRGPAAGSSAEISGMDWCDENLILLPQYPGLFGVNNTASVFSIPKAEIKAFLSGESEGAIEPELIVFDLAGLDIPRAGFEGFEAIVILQDQFYVTLETRQDDGMMGYLAMGVVEDNCSRFVLDTSGLISINPQAALGNMSDETIIVNNDRLFTLYEANGVNVNPNPVAHEFEISLESSSTLPMTNVEYRITDATAPDSTGIFWVINYFFPGDKELAPGPDRIALEFGVGASHKGAIQVERLVALEISEDAISLADYQPIYLELDGNTARNWEGVVRFEDGFLLVTDRHPSTILGYVADFRED